MTVNLKNLENEKHKIKNNKNHENVSRNNLLQGKIQLTFLRSLNMNAGLHYKVKRMPRNIPRM